MPCKLQWRIRQLSMEKSGESMIQSNKINIIVAVAVVSALIISVALVGIANMQWSNGSMKTEVEYATKIFGTDIISIEIIADEADWQKMLDNATSEQYIMADVVINGTKFQNVGIRPKGNSSLSQVASSDSDRYSFRLQFDEYIKDQTCFGLESFVLNNMLGDYTYMKEYVSYEIMREAGVDAPYFGYADIKVNGKSWGLYLAVELYNDSYEQRVFRDTSGMLYNVKSMDVGGKLPGQQDGKASAMPDMENPPTMPKNLNIPQRPNDAFQQRSGAQQNSQDNIGSQTISPLGGNESSNLNPQPNKDNSTFSAQMDGGNNRERNFAGRGPGGKSGGSLEYIDDNIESYSAIFNNVVGKGTEKDYQHVVQALKALSAGKDLETYFNVDKILRYLAAHTFVVNLDSYSSNMAQNYYIYERDGQITILPWDYNLAWGGFQNGSASSVINFPIDTPVSGVEMSSRPLIEKLFANVKYLERYHNYLQKLIDNYFANGKFAEKVNSLDALISDYVKNDATAFCTYEEYKTAVSSFITLGNLRAQSVQGQLDGTVSSTTSAQNANPDQIISAGDLKLSDLGNMMGGRGGNNSDFPGRMGGQDRKFPGGMNNGIDPEIMRKALDIIRQVNGEIGDEEKEALLSLGLNDKQIEQFSVIGGGRFRGDPQNGEPRELSNTSNLILIGVLTLVLIVALIFAGRFKKNY